MPIVLPAHTGLRAVAALLVVAFHYSAFNTVSSPSLQSVFRHGYLGVDLFFVLSGFIIHHVYRSKITAANIGEKLPGFLRYRLARIYPVHVAILLGLVSLHAMTAAPETLPSPEYSLSGVLSSLLLIHAWFGIPSPNSVSWSVSAEWGAYLIYPFALVASRNAPGWVRAAGLAVLVAVLHASWESNPLLRILPEFAMGVAAREVGFRLQPERWSRVTGLLAASAILLILAHFEASRIVPLCALFALLMLSLSNPRDLLARVLSTPLLVYGGEISYSLYMVHSPLREVLKRVADRFDLPIATSLGLAASIVLAVAVAALVYHAIEMPARRQLRGKGARVPNEATLIPPVAATPLRSDDAASLRSGAS